MKAVTLVSLIVSWGALLIAGEEGTPPYPIVVQATVSHPLKPAITPNTAGSVARSSLLGTTSASSPKPVRMQVLVLSADASEPSAISITTFLNQLGVPYTGVDLSTLTGSANRLDGLTLSNSTTGQGLYQGIILASGNLSGLLSAADWQKLDSYAAGWAVRVVSYYTWPEARYGLVPAGNGQLYKDTAPLVVGFTNAAESVFPYLNRSNSIRVGSPNGVFAYLASPTAASGETTTPILTAGGYTVGATHVAADGRETLALTMDNDPALLHSAAFNYGVISWVTKGVFLGSRQIYLSPHIDDLLIGDRLYAPARSDCPAASTCPTVYTSGNDMDGLASWQAGKRLDTQFKNFRSSFSFVGIGSDPGPGGWKPWPDTLSPEVTLLGSQFNWVSHTYSHENLNATTLTESSDQITKNVTIGTQVLNIPIDGRSLVTPFLSGLGNLNFLKAADQNGIQYLIMDSAYASTGPNTGVVNALEPLILQIPRRTTNLFDDVSTAATGSNVSGSLPDEYNARYGPGGQTPVFGQNQSYTQIIGNESALMLLNMLHYEAYPVAFHIANIYPYQGAQTLYTDLLDEVFRRYEAVSNLPVKSLTMSEIGVLLANRAKYNASGVTGVYTPGVSVVLTTGKEAIIPITGACFEVSCPIYGGQMQDSVTMPANSSVTLSLGSSEGAGLSSITLSPVSVVAGSPSQGMVILNGSAPSNGIVVSLTSDNAGATVPPSVTVTAGNSSAAFAVTTTAVPTTTTATITATYNGVSKTAALTITPAVALSSVSLNPASVVGGNSSTGTVTLSAAAPTGGTSVTLSSNNTAATLPASVTVASGASTAAFTVTTRAGSSSVTATITATYNGVSKTAALTITPAVALSSVSLNPASVVGGNRSTGTVTLSTAAPTGGTSVTLSSNNTAATLPASVTVASGASTAVFTVTTRAVSSLVTATITATYNGVSKTAALTITPTVALSSVSLNPASVVGGNRSTGTVTLSAAAPTGGISITLATSNTSIATVPASITIPAGSRTGLFTVSTRTTQFRRLITITASYAGTKKSATLTVTR